jgi:probable F420-dependent oxidoreductase
MTRPFRFIAPAPRWAGDATAWLDEVRRIEDLGFDTLAISEHVTGGWVMEATVAMTAAAMGTSRLRVLSLVLANDFRNPGLLRKAIATLDVLSEGRVELGLGTGWLAADYEALGIPFDPPAVRVDRLTEAVEILRALDGPAPVDHDGAHYRFHGLAGLPETIQRPRVPLLIGGGGPRILALAGRMADIAGIHARLGTGRLGPDAAADLTTERFAAKIATVRKAWAGAGRPAAGPELQATAYLVRITGSRGEVSAARSSFADLLAADPTVVADSPAVLIGSVGSAADQLIAWRERLGLSYWHLGSDIDAVTPIVARLSGS